MNKETLKVFKKLEEILLSHQKEKTGKYNFEIKNIKTYSYYEKNDVINIGYDFHKYHSVDIQNIDLFNHIKEYFTKEDSKEINLHIRERVRIKSFLNLLIRDIQDEKLQNKFIKLVFSSPEIVSSDTFDCITNIIKRDRPDLHKVKSITLKIVELISRQELMQQTYIHDSNFNRVLACFQYLSFDKKDYPIVQNLFNNFKKVIETHYESSNAINNFLKNKIPPKDWEDFKIKKDDIIDKNHNLPMFEINNNAKYHLIINEDFILNKYPVLSLSTDYFNMINLIVKHINLNQEELYLSNCKILNTQKKKTELYFISKDQTPVNENLIKSVLTDIIDIYSELITTKKAITNDFMDITFKAAILSSNLNESLINKNIEPKKIKSHKI